MPDEEGVCARAQRYAALRNLSEVSDDELTALMDHMDSCPACQQWMKDETARVKDETEKLKVRRMGS
jgi:hypothetical protein